MFALRTSVTPQPNQLLIDKGTPSGVLVNVISPECPDPTLLILSWEASGANFEWSSCQNPFEIKEDKSPSFLGFI